NDHGEVVDDASPQLGHLRREVRSGRDRIMRRLEAIIADPNNADAIQEPIVTERNGRYVIAVKAGYRHHIRGVVHDQSESGATLFLEPLVTVDMTNDWRQHQLDEQREVERILRSLSARLALEAAELEDIVAALATLDATFAKARLAERMEAVEPDLNNTGEINLIDARHPLLTGRVVPQTITIGPPVRALVITGPNTGGKTVALKTVGLLTLMAQCGLRIPAGVGSKVAVFDEVLADIGDEQSIEQSLSTFSGHMRNIVGMIRTVGPRSLVLVDELGAGTDPDEGSALARAILDYLLNRGATTVATTHYSELKTYALNHEGVQNASVEFDLQTLSPTYLLRIGTPGKSNALAIAARLGLPAEIVEDARGGLSEEHLRTESLLEDITRKERAAARERNRATREQREVHRLKTEAAAALAEAERVRQEARETAHAEVEAELSALRRETARLTQQLDRARQERDVAVASPPAPAVALQPQSTEPDPTAEELHSQLLEARRGGNRELAVALQAALAEAADRERAATGGRRRKRPVLAADSPAETEPAADPLAAALAQVRLSGGREALEALRTALRAARKRRDWRQINDVETELEQAQAGYDRETLQAVQQRLAAATQRLSEIQPRSAAPKQPVPSFSPGDYVQLPTFTQAGQLLTLPDARGEVEVQVGAFRVRALAGDLRSAARPRRHDEGGVAIQRAPQAMPPPSLSRPLDMRGLRADEVEPLLDRQLNDAFSAGIPYVKIIHGHGSGAVRKIVREYLAQQPYVSDYQPASPAEGGDGATMVTLAI
ncbi:MAG: Smr/MutS family protein, partial [Chloroflexi bacterium]|nr:Smr/MutS family protein [Chloroflexota bacterium]